MLSEELAKKNCETHHASGDADLLIVHTAVPSATSCNTVLVGDDTYLLVLLCYHASLESHDLFFCPEPKKNTKQPCTWNIMAVKQRLGPDMCQHILFLHAVLGCDTTSRPFSIIVADLTNAFVADLTAVVAELTAVVAELDVADSTCRRDGCRRLDLSPT